MQDLPVILKWHNFQSLEKALMLFMELKFCNSDVYFLNRRKMCRWPLKALAQCILGCKSVAIPFKTFYCHRYNNQHEINKKIIGSTLFDKKAAKTFMQATQVSYFCCKWRFKCYF